MERLAMGRGSKVKSPPKQKKLKWGTYFALFTGH
jgi:hypothetical protein